MPKTKTPEEALGPVEGAWARAMFPTPLPGEVIPYPEGMENVTTDDLEDAWAVALEKAAIARAKRRAEDKT